MNVEASQKRKGFLCLALIAVGMTVANVQSATYPDMPYTGPSPMPEFPAGFPAFDPPVTNLAPAADAPAIAEWTRSNEPGDTMILTGEDLTSQTGNSMGRDTRFVTYGVGSKVNDAFIQRLDGRMAALTLSSSLPFDEMYLMWPKNGIGYGKPVAINQTEAWWVGPNKVSKGDTFSVYGRNLQLGSDDCYLYIEELGLWLISDSANPYKADFILPHDIENGTYTLWVHNGKGREYGWAGSLRLTIEGVRLWNDDPDTWIDVTAAPYNAIGDGLANDHDAIRDAINDAKDGAYETVYLPAGTYAIDEQLIPRDDIRVIGDGMDRSIITTHSNFTGYGLCFSGFASSGPTEIWNLTLDAGDYLQNGLANKSLFDFAGGFSDLSFHNVSFDASDIAISESGGGIVLTGADNISFTGCKFITETSLNVAGGSRQIFIKDCDFYGINDAMFLVNVGSGREVSITGCTAQDFDNSNVNDGHGWAHGRFVTGNASASGIHKIYYGGNSTTNMMVRPAVSNQNTGETYMMEHGHIKYRSAPSFVTSNTASFASLATDYTGEIVAVVDGRGFGQHRLIASYSAGTITLDSPWLVEPDTSSILTIGNSINQHVIYDNYFDGKAIAPDDAASTVGVEMFGSHFSVIVDGNVFHQMKRPIELTAMTSATDISGNVTDPSYFSYFANNISYDCSVFSTMIFAIYGIVPDQYDTTYFGDVFCNNYDADSHDASYRFRAWQGPTINMDMCVFDSNTSTNFGTAVLDCTGVKNQTWVRNSFLSGAKGMELSSDHIPVLRENIWNNMTSEYVGDLPGATLELPLRVVALDNETLKAEIPIRNSGTDGLNWSASTTSEWVTLTQASGTVSDENSTGAFNVQADAESMPEGEIEAVVTVVSDAGQVQQMTIALADDASLPPPPDPPPAPVLTGIVISGSLSVDEGTTAQYICTASYSDGSAVQVAPAWGDNSGAVTIDGSGVLSAGDVDTNENVTVTASYGGFTDTHDVTINHIPVVLTGIVISGPLDMDEETTAQYVCTANYSDGTSATVVPSWSENSSYATISGSGVLTAGDVGSDQSVTVMANFDGQADTHAVTIAYVPPVLTAIVISGPASLNEETTAQYVCTAGYSDGTSAVIAPSWSENSAYTTISGTGLLNVGNVASDQSVTVSASFGGKTDTHAVTIAYVPPVLTGVTISGPASVNEETSAQYTCTANYSDGTSVVVAPSWSENSAYAAINASGLLNAGDVSVSQNTTIAASYGGKSDTFAVLIAYVPPAVESITISGSGSIEENTTAQYTCTAHYSDGSSTQVNPVWSEDSTFASIDGSGLLSAGNVTADDQGTVQASFDGKVATQVFAITAVGDQVVFPLNGFDGKTVSAELWDDAAQTNIALGEEFEPEEIVIENVNPDQWYWLGLREYDVAAGEWVLVFGHWIWM